MGAIIWYSGKGCDGMEIKVAIASSDGKVINAHFGRTPQFLIFQLTEKGYSFIEVRKNLPSCSNLDEPKGSMEDTIQLISDCQYVISSQIGPGMVDRLKNLGIIAYSHPTMIEDGLEALLHNL